jgi:hypothetical protein
LFCHRPVRISPPDGWRREQRLLGALAGVSLPRFLLHGAGIGLCALHALQLALEPAWLELLQRLDTSFETAIIAAAVLTGSREHKRERARESSWSPRPT